MSCCVRADRGVAIACALWLLAAGVMGCGGGGQSSSDTGGAACAGRCIDIWPSDDDQETLQRALIDARAGDVITVRAGTYHLTGQLSLDVDDFTVRGEGMNETILSFRGQTAMEVIREWVASLE
jgi:hypothetical protein